MNILGGKKAESGHFSTRMRLKSLSLCVTHSRDFADKMEEARLAREER